MRPTLVACALAIATIVPQTSATIKDTHHTLAADLHGGSHINLTLPTPIDETSTPTQLTCLFGTSAHSPARLHPDRATVTCIVPKLQPGDPQTVALTLADGAEPLMDALTLIYFDAISVPTLSAVSPPSADVSAPASLVITGSNFAPTGHMACRFRAENLDSQLTNASFVSPTEMRCDSPSVSTADADFTSITEPLQLSLDGTFFSHAGELDFTIANAAEPPVISALIPDHGPTDGRLPIEVHGSGFSPVVGVGPYAAGGSLQCRFTDAADGWRASTDATFVSSLLVRCEIPPFPGGAGWHGDVRVSVVPSDEAYGSGPAASNEALFSYFVHGGRPLVKSVVPAFSDHHHPASLALEGEGFSPAGSDLVCAFGDADARTVVAAHFVSAREVRCAAPHELPLGPVPVTLSADGGKHFGPDPRLHPSAASPTVYVFNAAEPPEVESILPVWAPISGTHLLTLKGANLAPTPQLSCVFERVGVTPATLVDEHTVTCAAPVDTTAADGRHAVSVGPTLVSLTHDMHMLSHDALDVDLVDLDSPPRVLLVSPPLASYAGGERLRVWGSNFSPHQTAACAFYLDGWVGATPASYVNATLLECRSPHLPHGTARYGTAHVHVWAAELEAADDPLRLARAATEAAAAACLYEPHPPNHGESLWGEGLEAGCQLPTVELSTTTSRLTIFHPELPPYVESVVAAYAPDGPDTRGAHVTVIGHNFAPTGTKLRCRFGSVEETQAAFINGTALTCLVAPSASAGDVELAVSLDGGASWSASLQFTYYEPQHAPRLSAVVPAEIDLADPPPHYVELEGVNFAPTRQLACGFGAARNHPTPATFVSYTKVRCAVPPLAWEHNLVDATTDGEKWSTESLHLIIFNSSAPGLIETLYPSALPMGDRIQDATGEMHEHHKTITLRGINLFTKERTGICTFEAHYRSAGITPPAPTAATALDAEHVVCEAPVMHESMTLSVSLELTGHNGGVTAGPGPLGDGYVTLSFYDASRPPELVETEPAFGERHEPREITIVGDNFAPAYAYKNNTRHHLNVGSLLCRFGLAEITAATFVHSHAVTCKSPYTEVLGIVDIHFSFDGGHSWVPTTAKFTFVDSAFPPDLFSVSPRSGAHAGGFVLEVEGDNFWPPCEERADYVARQHKTHLGAGSGALHSHVRGSNPRPSVFSSIFGRRLAALAHRLLQLAAPARALGHPTDQQPLDDGLAAFPRMLSSPHAELEALPPTELEAPPVARSLAPKRDVAGCNFVTCHFSTALGEELGETPATFVSFGKLRCPAPRVADSSLRDIKFALVGPRGMHSLPLDFTLYDPTVAPEILRYVPQGVPFRGGGERIVQIHGADFAPDTKPPPECRFGNTSPMPATFVRSGVIKCEAPASVGAPVDVRVSVSRGDTPSHAAADITFSLYDPESTPATVRAEPPYGPKTGGTTIEVSGSGFQPLGSELACVVGGVAVPAEFVNMGTVRCTLPPALPSEVGMLATVPLCVMHGGAASASEACGASVTYFDPSSAPTLSRLEPAMLSTETASAVVKVFGVNMVPTGEGNLLCRFGDEDDPAAVVVRPATFVRGDEVECSTPDSHDPGAMPISVSIDGGDSFSPPLPLARYDPSKPPQLLSVTPRYASFDAPRVVNITGSNFAPTDGLMCRFGHLGETPATFINGSLVQCETMRGTTTETVPLQVALLGPEGPWSDEASALPFVLYDASRPPYLSNFSKPFGALEGGEIVDLFGDDFAPEPTLGVMFGHLGGEYGHHLAHAGWRNESFAPAEFVDTNHVRVRVPPFPFPATVEVYATNDGKQYGSGAEWKSHSPILYTYYDPARPPYIETMEPRYGHHAVPTTVTIKGNNFAPTPDRLRVRWGALGENQGRFVDSTTILATSLLPDPSVLSMSVPLDAGMFSPVVPTKDRWRSEDLFTYWQPYLPPGLASASPLEGACAHGGNFLPDTRTGAIVEVANSEYVDVDGFNFVPSPHLSCVYHHIGGTSGFFGVDDYESFVPAKFVRSDQIRCPIPTTKYADDGSSLARVMWITVTNDGITYRYSHTAFTFRDGCLPTRFTTVMFGALAAAMLALCFLCFCGDSRRKTPSAGTRDIDFSQFGTDSTDDKAPPPPMGRGGVGLSSSASSSAKGWGTIGGGGVMGRAFSFQPLAGEEENPLADTGVLTVTIASARQLYKVGNSHLVISAADGRVERKSDVSKHASNPVWDSKHEFEGRLDELIGSKGIVVTVLSSKGAHGELVFARAELARALTSGSRELGPVDHPLGGRGSQSGSTLRARLQWAPSAKPGATEAATGIFSELSSRFSRPPPPQPSQPPQPPPPPPPPPANLDELGTLEVHLIDGKRLKANDKNGFSDPFVKVVCSAGTANTAVQPKTLNPRWDERIRFERTTLRKLLPSLTLKVVDRDKATFDKDDPLGECFIDLQQLPQKRAIRFEDVPLREVATGSLTVAVTWYPSSGVVAGASAGAGAASGAAAAAATPPTMQQQPTPAPPTALAVAGATAEDVRMQQTGTLAVLLVRAKNLRPTDKHGLSNPYVAIKVTNVGVKTWKSRVIEQTLQPEWNDSKQDTFQLRGKRADGSPSTLGDFMKSLTMLKLLDRRFGQDTLGELSFKLHGLRTRDRVEFKDEKLDKQGNSKDGAPHTAGSVHIVVTWQADG